MRLFTIAPEHDFLDVLADALGTGFPLDFDQPRPPLSRWTILVPTRRAARSLQQILVARAKGAPIVLPRIRPFGDVDEDELFAAQPHADLPQAISAAGQLHLLLGLVKDWARDNPQDQVARGLVQAPAQQLQMALSLQDLVNQMETEEADFSALSATYDLELAFHRSAVISLFEMRATAYQARLEQDHVMGPAARRNRLIRLQAEQLAKAKDHGPIIAAGSTGSNPATRNLLQVIATREQGAVIFPGLDTALNPHTVRPEHPQYAMMSSLKAWSIAPSQVRHLGASPSKRSLMIREALRPADAEASQTFAADVVQGITLVEARDQTEEARAIALRLRHHTLEGDGVAALITPDRTLAARVQAVLSRWHMRADDSAGEKVGDRGIGAVLLLVLEARRASYDAKAVFALLSNAEVTLGLAQDEAQRLAALLDITCVRGLPFGVALADFERLLADARQRAEHERHTHLAIKRLTVDDWTELSAFILRLRSVLTSPDSVSLASHIEWLSLTLEALVSPQAVPSPSSQAVQTLLAGLSADAAFAPEMSFDEAAVLLAHHIRHTTLRPPLDPESQILILGLPEARLVPLSLAILGGLNEGLWPAVPDTGPWLNRNMRRVVGLEMPERDIGLTAHDFAQGLARKTVMVTWSERLGGKPVLPSRLVLRVRSTVEATGLPQKTQLNQEWVTLARRMDQPKHVTPHRRPHARPPVEVRPVRFSVTEIEKLVRDSYHIHAKRILLLEPVKSAENEPDHSLRGSLIHAALGLWAHDPWTDDSSINLQHLLRRGEEVFAPYMHLPEVSHFWWVRFKRMARALIGIEHDLRANSIGVKAEIAGRLVFHVAGLDHILTARADRIDILPDGRLRIIDYKSGTPPSAKEVKVGFAPQLSLEAIIAELGRFEGLQQTKTSEAFYVKVSGLAKDSAKLEARHEDNTDFSVFANEQFLQLKALLAKYQLQETVYVPRHHIKREEEDADYDHLSRRREWEQSGGSS